MGVIVYFEGKKLIMAKKKQADNDSAEVQYTDEQLKAKMLEDVFHGTSFRETFKNDYTNCMRCWGFLRTDKAFKKEYAEILEMRLSGVEEDIITGRILDNLPTKVDRDGNEDLAPGYLKRAEAQIERYKWLLFKRNSKYQKQESTGDGEKLKVLVLPEKVKKEI